MASREEITMYEDEVRSQYGYLERMTDLVAVWEVALSDGVHKIEFEHGTTSGKRVVYVDGKEVIKRDWMFKLVGKETFTVGAAQTKGTINIDAVSGFAYEYTLEINGKSLKKYMENRSKTTNTWILNLDGIDCRVVLEKEALSLGTLMSEPRIGRPSTAAILIGAWYTWKQIHISSSDVGVTLPQEKDTMDVWCNGKNMETAGEFVDDGTETHFSIGNHDCCIKAVSSGKRREGIIHTLIVDDKEIAETVE